MKDTAPISQGIIAVAALFTIIAAGVAYVLYDFSLVSAVIIGAVVGGVAAIVLAIGWRDPQPGPDGKVVAPAPQAAIATAPAPKVAPAQEPAAKPAPVAADANSDGKPEFLDAAREGGADNLKEIKGVGPKLEKTLHEMGIYHFDQIAAWGPKEQAWMDENLEGFKGRATRDAWVAQAKTLAEGGETEFSQKVEKGGVY